MTFMGGGMILTAILFVLRMRFFWWPLHPAGYPPRRQFLDRLFLVHLFHQLGVKSGHSEVWQSQGVSTRHPILLRLDFGGFHNGRTLDGVRCPDTSAGLYDLLEWGNMVLK